MSAFAIFGSLFMALSLAVIGRVIVGRNDRKQTEEDDSEWFL
jgi:hypothetical protein